MLGPLVVSASYLIVTRLADQVRGLNLPPAVSLGLLAGAQAALVALNLSRAAAEIFHIRRPEVFLESTPVTLEAHLHVGLASRISRTAFAAALLLIGRWLISGGSPFEPVAFVSAVMWTALTATSEVWAALNWIHWSHKRRSLVAVASLVSMVPSVMLGSSLLYFTILEPVGLEGSVGWWLNIAGIAWTIILYLLTRMAHGRWRRGDVEFAQRIQPAARWSLSTNTATARLGPTASALLVRDLQLTLRGFSSAVYVAVGLATLCMLALIALLQSHVIAPDQDAGSVAAWLPELMAVKVACVLATASQSALTPVLVAYQIPTLWLERAVGTTGLDLCRAKIWYARIVSAPVPVAIWIAAMAVQPSTHKAAQLLGECLLLWWLVSSIIAVLSYETPARPGIALLILVTIATAVGILTASLWPFGVIIYVFSFGSLLNRARERARYFLITGDD